MESQDIIEKVKICVVKIFTPGGLGTRFFLCRSISTELIGIATAYHVVDHANEWQEPIKIYHQESNKTVLLSHTERAILGSRDLDTASIVFNPKEIQFPQNIVIS